MDQEKLVVLCVCTHHMTNLATNPAAQILYFPFSYINIFLKFYILESCRAHM